MTTTKKEQSPPVHVSSSSSGYDICLQPKRTPSARIRANQAHSQSVKWLSNNKHEVEPLKIASFPIKEEYDEEVRPKKCLTRRTKPPKGAYCDPRVLNQNHGVEPLKVISFPIKQKHDKETKPRKILTPRTKHGKCACYDARIVPVSRRIKIRHSLGRPRSAMDALLYGDSRFEIHSHFGQTAIATHNNLISHLVLKSNWNDFISSRDELQLLYVGTGVRRNVTAEILARTNYEFPVFYDAMQRSCVHYVGHFVVLRQDVKRFRHEKPLVFRGKPRCMQLQLAFSFYDEDLDETIRMG